MTLTQKETSLLNDLAAQEQLCIGKYEKCSAEAASTNLKNIFSSMAQMERGHLNSINDLLNGNLKTIPSSNIKGNNNDCVAFNYTNAQAKGNDAFLCKDMLTMEKHASSMYNTCVFEFKNPQARKLLSHIQSEEQQHGEQLYAYMEANGMYC